MAECHWSPKATPEICAVNSPVVLGWPAVHRLNKTLGLGFEGLITESDNHPGNGNRSLQKLFQDQSCSLSRIFKSAIKR